MVLVGSSTVQHELNSPSGIMVAQPMFVDTGAE